MKLSLFLRRLLFVALLLVGLLPATVRAQFVAPLAGTLLDARTQLPVPFATVAVPGQPGGTVSNAEGSFRLTLPTAGADSVRVQALGYAPLTVAAKPATGHLTLHLQPQSYPLQEVVVTAFSTPTTLLRQAVRHTTARMASPLGLHTYYREFASHNGVVAKFADALVDFYFEANPRRPANPQVQVRVRESRAGQAALNKDAAEAAIPSPIGIDKVGDYYSVTHNHPYLDSTKFSFYSYTLLETPTGTAGAPYYEVHCTPTTHDQQHLSQGVVRIDRRTLTIQQIDSEVPEQLKPYLFELSFMGAKSQIEQFRQRTDYREHQGRLYPSFVRLACEVKVVKDGVLSRYAFASDMLARDLELTPAPIPRKEQYGGLLATLYKRGTSYTRPYWHEGNVVAATAAEEAAIKSLEINK